MTQYVAYANLLLLVVNLSALSTIVVKGQFGSSEPEETKPSIDQTLALSPQQIQRIQAERQAFHDNWGRIDSDLIPEVLNRADVLLVTYDSDQWLEEVSNPHKFMQYLGCGKVIVATRTTEYDDKHHLLEMVDHPSDYISRLEQVLADLPQYNHPRKIAERKSHAQDHSYDRQLERISKALAEAGLSLE